MRRNYAQESAHACEFNWTSESLELPIWQRRESPLARWLFFLLIECKYTRGDSSSSSYNCFIYTGRQASRCGERETQTSISSVFEARNSTFDRRGEGREEGKAKSLKLKSFFYFHLPAHFLSIFSSLRGLFVVILAFFPRDVADEKLFGCEEKFLFLGFSIRDR